MAAISASKLGALTIEESLKRANVEKEAVEEVYMGNVLPGTLYYTLYFNKTSKKCGMPFL